MENCRYRLKLNEYVDLISKYRVSVNLDSFFILREESEGCGRDLKDLIARDEREIFGIIPRVT